MASESTTSTEDADLSTLVSSATLVLVGSLFGSASKLFEQLLLANVLPEAVYGDVMTGISLMMLCSTFALVGFGQGIPRFMSRFDDERDVRGVWVTGIVLAGTASMSLAAALLVGGQWLNRTLLELGWTNQLFFAATSALLPALFVLTIPLMVGLKVAFGAIQGRGNTIYRTYSYDLLYNGLRVGVLLSLLFVAGIGALAAGFAYVIGAGVAVVAAHLLLGRLFSLRGAFRTHTGAMVRFSAPLIVASTVSILFANIDNLMLNSLVSSAASGAYNYGYPIAGGLPVILSVFGFLYMPLASRLDADGDHAEVARIYKVTTKWIYIAAFPVFLTFVAFPNDLVRAVMPTTDPRAGMVLAILSIGFFMSAANGRCQDTLSAFGHTGYILVVNTVTAVLNIVLNLALIPVYGIVGAALASALSFFLLNAFALVVLWYKSGITPFSRWTIRTFLLLPAVLFPPALALSGAVRLSLVTIPMFAVLAGVAAVVLVAVTGCLQPEDEIPVELVEDRLGVRIPYIRRYIPSDGP